MFDLFHNLKCLMSHQKRAKLKLKKKPKTSTSLLVCRHRKLWSETQRSFHDCYRQILLCQFIQTMFVNSQNTNISRQKLPQSVSITDWQISHRDMWDFIPRSHLFRSSYDIFLRDVQHRCQFALWLQRVTHWPAEGSVARTRGRLRQPLVTSYSNQETQLTSSLLTNNTPRTRKQACEYYSTHK